jgi:hypothetical protein
MLFHLWVVSKPPRFITMYAVFKWSSITDCHLNQIVTCSKVNACGTKHEKTFLYSSPTWFTMTVFCTVSLLMSRPCTIIRSDRWWLFRCYCPFNTTPEWQPLLGLSWTSSCPSCNCPYQRKMLDCISASPQKAACTISTYSVAVLLASKKLYCHLFLHDNMVLLHNIKQKCTLELFCSHWHNFARNKFSHDSNQFQQWLLDSTVSILWIKSAQKLSRCTVHGENCTAQVTVW